MTATGPPNPATRPLRRPPIPGTLGRLLERAYRFELDRRNRAFDRGTSVRQLDLPVISVGNLSVGGTGKTPMVRTIAQWLVEAGFSPAIALRGYKAKQGVSDEAAEYQRELPAIPLAVGPDRYTTIQALRADPRTPPINAIILDDGFQHRQLARNLDIVLLDATRWPFDDRCLPAGWLREPVESLSRAHMAIITRADLTPNPGGWLACAEQLKQRFPHLTIAACAHRWVQLAHAEQPSETYPLDWLNDRSIVIATGIGNPDAFLAQAKACTPAIERVVTKPDHHAWSVADAELLASHLQSLSHDAALLTTGKDWVKLARIAPPIVKQHAVLPQLSLSFLQGEAGARQRILDAAQATSSPMG